jgi:protein subunit release factor A
VRVKDARIELVCRLCDRLLYSVGEIEVWELVVDAHAHHAHDHELRDEDLRVEIYRPAVPGPAGATVRILHVPTGKTSTATNRSSLQAKAEALAGLRTQVFGAVE